MKWQSYLCPGCGIDDDDDDDNGDDDDDNKSIMTIKSQLSTYTL